MRNAHQNLHTTEKYCYGNSWGWYNETEQEKEAKRYAAYLMLCDYFGLHDEFDEQD